jgi:GntR family transcriptional regulator of arabinose operon
MNGEPAEHRYQQVKRELREAIARRDYEPDRPFITQREVCQRFGVSTTTAACAGVWPALPLNPISPRRRR